MTNIVNSSLIYEILMYLNSFYLGMFVFCEVSIGILKAINMAYPENALLTQAGIFSAYCLVEVLRIYLGRRGNLGGNTIPIYVSLLLTVPSTIGVCYMLLYQTYVLRLEFIWCIVMLLFYSLETAFALISIIALCRKQGFE